ncbi:MAG: hypothetical protein JW800_00860 [Candidatus Omnitrophica bacterium]|nr:hypothetical protein [Candidatus Omnitrophota bacterium]
MLNRKIFVSMTAVLGIICIACGSYAVEDQYELYPSIGKKEKYPEMTETEGEYEAGDRFVFDLSSSLETGYDTNAYLEHYDEAASIFLQNAVGVETRSLIFEECVLRLAYDMTYLDYLRFAEPDLFDNIFTVGLDTQVTEKILWSLDYSLDLVGYPHDEASEYSISEIETGLKHSISDGLYHRLVYRYSNKEYTKWKIRNRVGTVQSSDREDKRNTIKYEMGYYMTDRTFLKPEFTVYFNDSNEAFIDYYDYTSIQTQLTGIHFLTDKIFTRLNAGYQYKSYDNRVVSDQDRGDQRDHLLSAGVSLFYDLNKNISLGTNFDYRKNFSNENSQKYTDYIMSCGIYYTY